MSERTWLSEARQSKGLSKSDLAKEVRVGRSYISEIEKGNKTPSGKRALKISRVLGVNMEKFYEEDLAHEELQQTK